MLPEFPNGKRLELSDKQEIEEITSCYPPYSDFNFVSLWSYNIDDQCQISRHYGNLVIRYNDYVSGEPFYTFLGTNQVVKVMEDLLGKSMKEGIKQPLKLVPAFCVKGEPCEEGITSFDIKEDPSNFDYVYRVEDLIELRGRKYRSRRQSVTRFKRCVPDYKILLLDLSDNSAKKQIISLLGRWADQKCRTTDETENELRSLIRSFQTYQYCELFSFGIFLGNDMAAFSINEKVHHRYYMGHFGKADHSYPGIEQFMEHEVARRMYGQGCVFLNLQQDLGMSGMERSKKLWKPSHMLKKVTIQHLTG